MTARLVRKKTFVNNKRLHAALGAVGHGVGHPVDVRSLRSQDWAVADRVVAKEPTAATISGLQGVFQKDNVGGSRGRAGRWLALGSQGHV